MKSLEKASSFLVDSGENVDEFTVESNENESVDEDEDGDVDVSDDDETVDDKFLIESSCK